MYIVSIHYNYTVLNKRPTGLNGHLNITDFTLTSRQKGADLHINSPILQ